MILLFSVFLVVLLVGLLVKIAQVVLTLLRVLLLRRFLLNLFILHLIINLFNNLSFMSQRILDTGNPIMVDRPSNRVPSNYFDLSHDVKLSANFGKLVPINLMECLPGDKFSISSEALVRFQPLIAPMMHRVNIRSEWFFVPTRLLWDNWESFISPPQRDGIAPAVPTFSEPQQIKVNSLGDYLGLPATPDSAPVPVAGISVLPYAAYQRVYNDWYRDEDLDAGTENIVRDGSDNTFANFDVLQNRNWDRDYFTSAKPWPQKGDDVLIPSVTSTLPISIIAPSAGGQFHVDDYTPSADERTNIIGAFTAGNPDGEMIGVLGGSDRNMHYDPNGSLGITSSDFAAAGGTIEDLRKAEALQKFLEADSRGGTRYIETIKQHFGVRSSDSRLQRAEYIGSTFQPLVISEVLNTTGETDGLPQGNMAGHGISAANHSNNGIHYSCEEHGFIIGIMSVLPVTGYSQGVHKLWTRTDRLDYCWPEFAELGEQEVLNNEIYHTNTDSDANIFGYLPRYSEYRFMGNRIAGDFRTSLDYWHLSRLFASLPGLDGTFLQCDQSTQGLDRVFAVIDPTVQHILCHWFHKVKCLRKLPRYVVPST